MQLINNSQVTYDPIIKKRKEKQGTDSVIFHYLVGLLNWKLQNHGKKWEWKLRAGWLMICHPNLAMILCSWGAIHRRSDEQFSEVLLSQVSWKFHTWYHCRFLICSNPDLAGTVLSCCHWGSEVASRSTRCCRWTNQSNSSVLMRKKSLWSVVWVAMNLPLRKQRSFSLFQKVRWRRHAHLPLLSVHTHTCSFSNNKRRITHISLNNKYLHVGLKR